MHPLLVCNINTYNNMVLCMVQYEMHTHNKEIKHDLLTKIYHTYK